MAHGVSNELNKPVERSDAVLNHMTQVMRLRFLKQ